MSNKVCDLPVRYGDAVLHLFLTKQKEPAEYQVCPIHKHIYYELHSVCKGTRLYRINHQEILLREHELLIIPPGCAHEPLDPNSREYQIITLPFSLEQTQDSLSFYALFAEALNQSCLHPVVLSNDLLKQLDALVSLPFPVSAGEYCRFQVLGTSFFCELFHLLHCFDSQVSAFHPLDGLPARLDTLVHQSDLPLRSIAQILHYSERHTARLIRQIYHMTLSELRTLNVAGEDKEVIT